MSKRTELKCPICGKVALKASVCKDVEIECRECQASLLITQNIDGSCTVSARPQKQAV